ncbi:hypothetical protein F4778DRAFT_751716 [Xylariomycetidae sp. FL2044]|nr:hypothetical protein F4778DRAFT_751716 [Xylariomycetidae sp. FL2044]
MTTIDEVEEMDDFVNWDAALATNNGFDMPIVSEGAPDESNMDLVFGNVEGDDWSFWALEHFESTQLQHSIDLSAPPAMPAMEVHPEAVNSQMYWETPEAPCTHCDQGGYQCKMIREGKYKGYCTSCVALRCGCSFGPSINNLTAEAGATFPANPWPTMGDRPETSILHEDEITALVASATPMAPNGMTVSQDDKASLSKPPSMPKIGARFSRESVKILKNWLTTHSRHPYPTEEEKENLQKMTGLNKTQITNWLANARRRGKIQPTRATSAHVGRGYAQAVDIPRRSGKPGIFENMNPLQRWANSPPENEPASATAIARAVSASSSFRAVSAGSSYSQTSGSGRNSPYVSNYSDDGSSKSLCNQSSASSRGTSQSSNGSFASAYSNKSRGSFGSLPPFARTRGRRRRRRAPPRHSDENLNQPLKTFQCTFCTETFRTKHDWQRHEKSLHLSLERWICSPDGPKCTSPENGVLSCVFCGAPNPDEAHVESHNFSSCTERTPEERTFYRKDHLRQHLKLVHNVKFLPWTMDRWRVASPEIRSRCGFCGIVLDSWTIRTDHLAEHFKTGNTMADWKGDWGFESPVLELVENSIPPYLIHDERGTPLPFMATQAPPAMAATAYDLLKLELQSWLNNKIKDGGNLPTDAEMQLEACRIIFASEVSSPTTHGNDNASSWLRDLIMSSDDMTRAARFQPIRTEMENQFPSLRIIGRKTMFDQCDFEKQLQDFVKARELLGLTTMDHELQVEACRVIGRIEERANNPSELLANWLLRLIHASPGWLQAFRQRAHLPGTEDAGDVHCMSKDPNTIDSNIHSYSRLDAELDEFLQVQRSLGLEPADTVLQRQARIIVYGFGDEWNQTAADDTEWLNHFRQRHTSGSGADRRSATGKSPSHGNSTSSRLDGQQPAASNPGFATIKSGPCLFNDTNCYRRLARDLSRFVASTMSANNPNCHIPTDQELQHQARWIIYDDDDPWNTTAADNAEWLQRFKVDVGILPKEPGPELALGDVSLTGFAPPYVAANAAATMEVLQEKPNVIEREGTKSFEPEVASPNRYQKSLTQRSPALTETFWPKELESGLSDHVRRELRSTGVFPSDDALRQRARQIMGMQKTPCDDATVLGKIKAAMQAQGQDRAAGMAELPGATPSPVDLSTLGYLPAGLSATTTPNIAPGLIDGGGFLGHGVSQSLGMDLDLNFTEQEMNDLLQDASFGFGTGTSTDLESPSMGNTGAGTGLGH